MPITFEEIGVQKGLEKRFNARRVWRKADNLLKTERGKLWTFDELIEISGVQAPENEETKAFLASFFTLHALRFHEKRIHYHDGKFYFGQMK